MFHELDINNTFHTERYMKLVVAGTYMIEVFYLKDEVTTTNV